MVVIGALILGEKRMDYNVSLEAEKSVLGSMILSQRAATKGSTLLDGNDFFRPGHTLIFEAIQSLVNKRLDVDLVTLRAELGSDLVNAGGMDYLMQIAEYVPSAANLETYSKIVKDRSMRRKLVEKAGELVTLAKDDEQPIEDVLTKSVQSIISIQKGNTQSPLIKLGKAMQEWDDQLLSDDPSNLYSTGFPTLDKSCGGFGAGDQVIVGAYSGMGKTSFAFETCLLSCQKSNKPWVFFSMEMTANQLISRFIQSRTGIGINRQRQRDFNEMDYTLMANYMEEFHALPIYILDSGAVNPANVRLRLSEVAEKHGCVGGFVIDYLGMAVKSHPQHRATAVEQFCFETKEIAKEYGCTSIILSQLSRESVRSDNREPDAPSLHHLKESGGIEASADLVFALHRPEYWKAKKEERKEQVAEAYIHILKQRYGATGVVELAFVPTQARWVEKK
jgi:replicative DNA helicase